MLFLFIILLIIFIALYYIAQKCLMLIVKPVIYSAEEMRQQAIDHGFGDCVDAYENQWNREAFTLNSEGVILSGEIIRNPEAKGNRVAIICHGHTVNRWNSLKYADIFYRRGYHVVIYDERHFGASTGDFCTLGEYESKDLLNVITYVREIFGKDCFLALHGESMGAATTLLVLRYTDVNLVIADCPFCDSERLFNEYIRKNMSIPPILVIPLMEVLAKLQYNYHIKETSPMEAVRNTDVPICFMHGTADTLIVCDHSETMSKLCKNPKSRLHLFPDAEHARSIVIDRQHYEKLVDDFLRDCGGLSE